MIIEREGICVGSDQRSMDNTCAPVCKDMYSHSDEHVVSTMKTADRRFHRFLKTTTHTHK